LAEAAETLSSTTRVTQTDLQHQQTDIQQVATAMDQMTAVVNQVSDNTRTAADAADEAKSATLNGRAVVDKSIDEINGLAENIENASQVIQRLELDVTNISKVLDVIRGIAEQTNLLALNAAIEAARAGEQGRGFAVVADEVRTLAGRTQESTREIQEMIEQLESGAAQAVQVMLDSRERAERSVEQAASTGISLGTIDQAVTAINEMNQQIANSTREQAIVTEEVHRNITRIKDLSEQTDRSARSMSESGQSVSSLAQDMDRLVNRFKI
jgi:methyl-accepting chemotaxis protein